MHKKGLITKVKATGSMCHLDFMKSIVLKNLQVKAGPSIMNKSQTNNWQKATLSLKKWSPIKSLSKGSYITPAVNYDGKASWASLTRPG